VRICVIQTGAVCSTAGRHPRGRKGDAEPLPSSVAQLLPVKRKRDKNVADSK
jgi:hypothetical protein